MSAVAQEATTSASTIGSSRLLLFRGVLLLAIFALWQGAVAFGVLDPRHWSSPILALERLIVLLTSVKFWPHFFDSLLATLLALALSGVLGTALALVFARRPLLEATVDPLLAMLQGIPRIAFAPLFVLFLGVGLSAKVTLSVSIVLFVFYANAQQGLRKMDDALLRSLQLMGADRRQQIRMAVLPALLPWLWAALDLGLGLALIGVIISEFISSTRGIGHLIVAASLGFDTTGLIALLLVTMGMVIILRGVLGQLRKRFLPRF